MSNDYNFVKSNLFIFLLGQGFAFICWLLIFAFGWGKYSARFEEHDGRISSLESAQKRMDEHGSAYMQHIIDQQNSQLGEFKAKIDRIEINTSHFDVMEAEHLRLTKDVEDLKLHEKK